jgi:hypothetical protein
MLRVSFAGLGAARAYGRSRAPVSGLGLSSTATKSTRAHTTTLRPQFASSRRQFSTGRATGIARSTGSKRAVAFAATGAGALGVLLYALPKTGDEASTEANADVDVDTIPEFEAMIRRVQDEICDALAEVDGTPFREDTWVRPEGGGGRTRVLQGGKVFEKAGVNTSIVHGKLPPRAVEQVSRGALLFCDLGLGELAGVGNVDQRI